LHEKENDVSTATSTPPTAQALALPCRSMADADL